MAYKEEYCKICDDGKPYKNLNAHLRIKHNMLRFEYDKRYNSEEEEEQLQEIEEEDKQTEEKETVSPSTTGIDTAIDGEMKLSDFLDTYNISEEQLRSIMGTKRAFKTSTDMRTELKERKDTARRKCKSIVRTYKESGSIYKNSDLDVVEMLVNEYDFKVVNVVSQKTNEPKHWVLEKL